MNRADVIRLLHDYNSNPKAYNDEDADIIANLAKSYGVGFKRSGKAGQKFLFELADTALLGMVPNEWRPEARGDKYFGETGLDRVASAGGMIGGAFAGGLGAFAGRHMAGRAVGKGLGYAQHYGPKAYSKGVEYAGKTYTKGRDLASRANKGIGNMAETIGGVHGKAKTGLSSLDRGKNVSFSNSYLNNIRNRYNRGFERHTYNPIRSMDDNLLMLSAHNPAKITPLSPMNYRTI